MDTHIRTVVSSGLLDQTERNRKLGIVVVVVVVVVNLMDLNEWMVLVFH